MEKYIYVRNYKTDMALSKEVSPNDVKKRNELFGMKEKYYLNRFTGEITEDHRTAIEWYRNGYEVEIWKDGKFAVAWIM